MGRQRIDRVRRAEMFWERVQKGDRCWLWMGPRTKTGYGITALEGKSLRAQRAAWIYANGRDIPAGMVIMHVCDNPPCVRPEHLRPGTRSENMWDMIAKGRAARGERGGSTKLTEDKVRAIRELHAGGTSAAKLGAMFGVTGRNIGKIVRRKTWRIVSGSWQVQCPTAANREGS